MAAPSTCPHCHEPVASTDSFCEACGADLASSAAPAVLTGSGATTPPVAAADDAAAHDHAATGGPRTSQTARVADPLDPARNRTCLACGGAVDDDGFCSVCGQRAPVPRDHWTESPSAWVGGVCDKGIVHARNEDAMALASTTDRTRAVLVVCDGVTSAPDSDRASIAAARAACRVLTEAPGADSDSFPARLTHWEQMLGAACRDANAEAVGVAHRLGDPIEPPSCTFVAAVVDGDLASVAWCGDSRAYWLPDAGDGVQLGLDHSVGTWLIASGMSREEAERDPGFHTITRWLGADSFDATPECVSQRLDAPGWVLVCSDGMWNYASEPAALHELIETARRDGAADPTVIAEAMAAWANAQGGHDNVSVALARIDARVP